MTRSLIFANRKGGCGKTTTAVNIAHALAEKGKKILLIDVDPQSHATVSFGISPGSLKSDIFHLLTDESDLKDVIIQTHINNISLIPSSRDLIGFEIEFSAKKGSEALLSEKLTGAANQFDYLIFDPPPTVGLLMVSALAAANEVFIPMQTHFLAMEGLAEMIRLIYTVNSAWNPNLKLAGIIPTFFNKSTRLAKEVTDDIIRNFGEDKLFPAIRMNISLAEAPGHGKTIFEYAPKSMGALDYIELADKIRLMKSRQ